jgi:hypothetical protein
MNVFRTLLLLFRPFLLSNLCLTILTKTTCYECVTSVHESVDHKIVWRRMHITSHHIRQRRKIALSHCCWCRKLHQMVSYEMQSTEKSKNFLYDTFNRLIRNWYSVSDDWSVSLIESHHRSKINWDLTLVRLSILSYYSIKASIMANKK